MQCRTCGAMLPSGTQACMRCGSPVYMPVSSPAHASANDATAFDPSLQRAPFSQYPPTDKGGAPQTSSPFVNPSTQSQRLSPFGSPPAQTPGLNTGYSPYQLRPGTGALQPPQQQPPVSYQQAGPFGMPSSSPQGSSLYNQSIQGNNYQPGNNQFAASGQMSSSAMPGNAPFMRTGQLNPMPGSAPFSPQGQGLPWSGNNGFSSPPQGQVASPSLERLGNSTEQGSKKKSRTRIFFIALIIIVLLGGGATYFLSTSSGTSMWGGNTIPSGRTIDPVASAIITSAQTASSIDQQTYGPATGHMTSTFKVKQPIYVTFKLNPSKYDLTKQKAYILVQFYMGSKSVINNDQPYPVTSPIDAAYFVAQYYATTDNGAAEIYWCHQSNCSDRALAQVVYFSVTN